MPRRLRVFYSMLTGVLLLIPAIALYSELSKRSDIWWTPRAMALSLDESRDRVEVYARDHPLVTLLEQGRVSITDGAVSEVLKPQDVGLRFNNWYRIRAQRLPLLLLYAAACGGGVVLLLMTATGRLSYREEHEVAPR